MSADTDGETGVPIVCSECGTETKIPLSEVATTLEDHNETRHDGEDIAQVDPTVAEELADLVAEDLDLV
jgi:hypothetical protein